MIVMILIVKHDMNTNYIPLVMLMQLVFVRSVNLGFRVCMGKCKQTGFKTFCGFSPMVKSWGGEFCCQVVCVIFDNP